MSATGRYLIPLLIIAVLLIGGCGGPQPEPIKPPAKPTPTSTPSADGSAWGYRLQGNVTPSGACVNLSRYQMRLTLHYGDGISNGGDVYLNYSSQDDFDDIRFTAGDGETLLDHWVQDVIPGVNATAWVEFDSIPDGGASFYIYYGNPGARSASDIDRTFMISNDGASTFGWSKTGSEFSWSATGGVIKCTSNNYAWSNLYRVNGLDTDYYVIESEIRAQDSNVSANYQQGIGCLNNPMARWLEHGDYWQIRDPFSSTDSDPDVTFNAAQWHSYAFVINGTIWELFVDGDLKVTHDAGYTKRCAGMYMFTESPGHWVEFDDLIVRRYCNPEPIWGSWADEAEKLVSRPETETEPESNPTPTIPPITTPPPGPPM